MNVRVFVENALAPSNPRRQRRDGDRRSRRVSRRRPAAWIVLRRGRLRRTAGAAGDRTEPICDHLRAAEDLLPWRQGARRGGIVSTSARRGEGRHRSGRAGRRLDDADAGDDGTAAAAGAVGRGHSEGRRHSRTRRHDRRPGDSPRGGPPAADRAWLPALHDHGRRRRTLRVSRARRRAVSPRRQQSRLLRGGQPDHARCSRAHCRCRRRARGRRSARTDRHHGWRDGAR